MSRRGIDSLPKWLPESLPKIKNLKVVKRTMSWGGFDLLPKSLPK